MEKNKPNNSRRFRELSDEELAKLVLNAPLFKQKKKDAIELLERIGLPDGSKFKAPLEIKKDLF
ncbi:MAG: hypothetical protein RLZZ420_382 [Bacteroidota bacterium]|jgi:hypothetical protein